MGIGAVGGGGANLALGRAVVKSFAATIGALPAVYPGDVNSNRAPKLVDTAAQGVKNPEADTEGGAAIEA